MPRFAPPNIVYIHSHDTGRFVAPYGQPIATPNIQSLAESGVLFRQAFCAAPTCSPSRAALLTGQAPHSNGMMGLAHRGFALHEPTHLLPHTLRQAGYRTVRAGVQHVARWQDTASLGYDVTLDGKQGGEENARDFLRDAPQPFFLDVGFTETHRFGPHFNRDDNGKPSARGDGRYALVPPHLPDHEITRADFADYVEAAKILDQKIGVVLEALEQNNLTENTLVICTTDHGIAFPGMKCHLTDRGIGVMLILRGPDVFSGGQVCDALVSQIDVFPTLCDLLEIEKPAWLQGQSLLPLLRGEAEEINEQIFAEVTYHAAYEPQRCVRTRRWKYIRRYDGRGRRVLPNIDDSPTKALLMEHGWGEQTIAEEQLYDVFFDPQEMNNLAHSPAHADTLHEMRARLEKWMHATNDPLLHGPVPAPRGAQINDPTGLSPNEAPITVE